MCHNKAKNIESARRIGIFFRCFGSHFGNLARHFKVGTSNVIYYSVHVNTLVIKSAVHCLQLCTIIMMGNFVRRFPLAEKSFHLIQFYSGFTFPLAFKSNNNLHDLYFLPIALCCFCNHTFGHAPQNFEYTTVRRYGTNEMIRINSNVFFLSYWTISFRHSKLN